MHVEHGFSSTFTQYGSGNYIWVIPPLSDTGGARVHRLVGEVRDSIALVQKDCRGDLPWYVLCYYANTMGGEVGRGNDEIYQR